MRVLFDTNVVLDFLQRRMPFFTDARDLMVLVALREVEGVVTAKELTDIHYVMRKSLGDAAAREKIADILSLFTLADTSAGDLESALFSTAPDFEDAVMAATALRCGADAIVTRDTKGFGDGRVQVLEPRQLLSMLHPEGSESSSAASSR